MIRLIWLVLLCGTAYAETYVELGPSYVSSDHAGTFVYIEERFSKARYGIGVGYVSEQTFAVNGYLEPFNVEPNIFVSAQRYWRKGCLEVSLGPTYFQNRNRALPRNLTLGVSIACVGNRLSIRFRHYSNAGSGPYEYIGEYPNGEEYSNLGQDAFTIGWRF